MGEIERNMTQKKESAAGHLSNAVAAFGVERLRNGWM